MRIPQPGDIGFSIIDGRVGTFVNLGQSFIRDSSEFTHAFLVLPGDRVVQAMPGGAEIVPLSQYLESDKKLMFSNWPMTQVERTAICNVGQAMVGTGYSFLTYLYLAMRRFGWDFKWLSKKIKNRGNMICSQLVDFCYNAGGVHLFTDGRTDGNVTPGDLVQLLIDNDSYWIRPGNTGREY